MTNFAVCLFLSGATLTLHVGTIFYTRPSYLSAIVQFIISLLSLDSAMVRMSVRMKKGRDMTVRKIRFFKFPFLSDKYVLL